MAIVGHLFSCRREGESVSVSPFRHQKKKKIGISIDETDRSQSVSVVKANLST